MRPYIVFLVLIGMLVGIGMLLFQNPRESYKAPREELVVEGDGGSMQDAQTLEAGPAGSTPPVVTPPPAAGRLRVAVLSWELAAPIAGMDPSLVEATVLSTPAAVETRLARGGDDPDGADLAVMPLPELAGLYDRLRALDPMAVAVAGYSHGIEELTGPGDGAPPKAGDTVGTSGDASATTLALFALDFVRADVSKIKLVTDPNEVANAGWAAAPRGTVKKRIVLSSADASRLLPEVIVAPRRTREAKKADAEKFLAFWFAGVARVRDNASGVAKDLEARKAPLFSAASEKPAGALAIVERLGHIEWAGTDENALAFGLVDQKVAHVDDTLGLEWRLLRTAGVVGTSTPAALPVSKDLVADVVKPAPQPPKPPPADLADDAGAPKGLNVLLSRKYDDLDEAALLADVGVGSRMFDHAILRVTVRGGNAPTRTFVKKARADSMSDRIYPGNATLGTSAAMVEICAAP